VDNAYASTQSASSTSSSNASRATAPRRRNARRTVPVRPLLSPSLPDFAFSPNKVHLVQVSRQPATRRLRRLRHRRKRATYKGPTAVRMDDLGTSLGDPFFFFLRVRIIGADVPCLVFLAVVYPGGDGGVRMPPVVAFGRARRSIYVTVVYCVCSLLRMLPIHMRMDVCHLYRGVIMNAWS